ncbi:protein-disulfide reductase DsbD family protein [Litoreibacter halocynthiae]|nr:protein-disulfide reductase DsbD domain-containing protein [Litoreibacter halocynthiae]
MIFLISVLWAPLLHAASSESFSNFALSARLISVENGVAPNVKTLSLGLDLELAEGWKAYWRSPGEVGLPPEIDWQGSRNLETSELLWPAPQRFTAFGIENFGYHDRVVLPILVVLEEPGAPVELAARVTLLTCSDICVPHDFNLTLAIPAGNGVDTQTAALVTKFAQRIPAEPSASNIVITSAALTNDALVITATSSEAFQSPDVFPEMGSFFTFGQPDIRTSASGTSLWAQLPLLSRDDATGPLRLTVTDGARAVTAQPDWSDFPAEPPYKITVAQPDVMQLISIAVFAFLGGLILNFMPCVLPVLSIKLASVMAHADRSAHTVRGGFLMSALGVLAFMWVLATGVLALQAAGMSIGWGLQFQNSAFLTIMFMILVVFAANLFGVFEISLPSALQRRLASAGAREGYLGDFATGAFAAVLATPCSAPFLGTAIAFALTGRAIDTVLVFTSLGLGLALPYLLFAVRPQWVKLLPKPGRWMIVIKWVMGLLLTLTAIWLLWVLNGVAGAWVVSTVFGLSVGFVFLAALPRLGENVRIASLVSISALAFLVASNFTTAPTPRTSSQDWAEFDRSEIPRLVSQGKTVFVDVTADWCLTCKANKALVLDREPVAGLLQAENIVPMQADWTRPDPEISRYLETHNRFGIPFNIVYGPNAPSGVLLSEILSSDAVIRALEEAQSEKSTNGF